MHNGKMAQPSKEEMADQSAEIVQNRIRGILARKEIEEMRQEEMIFLGMVRRPKTAQERLEDPILKAEETRKIRKEIQEDHMNYFEKAKVELKEEIKDVEGGDIEDRELKKRRDWIQ